MNQSLHATPEGAISPITQRSRVVALNRLSSTGYELIIERNGINFKPGQLINLHGRDHHEDRSYSVCSGVHDPYLTVIFRLIPTGVLTPQLVRLKPGDTITVSGPYGEFLIRDRQRPLMFFATGTGVAPCRCYLRSHPVASSNIGTDVLERTRFRVRKHEQADTGLGSQAAPEENPPDHRPLHVGTGLGSQAAPGSNPPDHCPLQVGIGPGSRAAPGENKLHPDLNITLIHGVRLGEDLFYRDEFSRIAYQPCLTGEAGAWPGAFAGRVTDFARTITPDPEAHYYLCGANEMIYEMQEWLESCKIDRAHIFTEAYYYRSDDS